MKIIYKLCELYNSNKINYNSDDNVVLEYDDKEFIDYEIDISLNKQEDKDCLKKAIIPLTILMMY